MSGSDFGSGTRGSKNPFSDVKPWNCIKSLSDVRSIADLSLIYSIEGLEYLREPIT